MVRLGRPSRRAVMSRAPSDRIPLLIAFAVMLAVAIALIAEKAH